jgi:hypothetical protein
MITTPYLNAQHGFREHPSHQIQLATMSHTRIACVTGANKGIGLAIGKYLDLLAQQG